MKRVNQNQKKIVFTKSERQDIIRLANISLPKIKFCFTANTYEY